MNSFGLLFAIDSLALVLPNLLVDQKATPSWVTTLLDFAMQKNRHTNMHVCIKDDYKMPILLVNTLQRCLFYIKVAQNVYKMHITRWNGTQWDIMGWNDMKRNRPMAEC